jgi:2,3-bisphosphoglycerate-independent phosphoglycerate mutase
MLVIMIGLEHLSKLAHTSPSKIVLLVIDGLGGLPRVQTNKTELESARKPNLDQLARDSICGLTVPISSGITAGSTPGHLAIFGYDPIVYSVGRGIVEALGIDLELKPNDIAARGNFCTVDSNGIIIDRRAGRISTEQNINLCYLLNEISINGVEIMVHPVKEHRFVLILRGDGLSAGLEDSDPQQVGLQAKSIEPLSDGAEGTARIANEFIAQAKKKLQNERDANMVLLRGFSRHPNFPTIPEIYKLKPCAIAIYPMYRGLARMLEMQVLPAVKNIAEEMGVVSRYYKDYDFFFVHYKNTDSRGEDGDFDAKVKAIEELDAVLPELLQLNPDVLVVAGDHSTPATLAMHSWHPVPFLLNSKWCRPDSVTEFSEMACNSGSLGRFPAVDIMPLAMANALKLQKFGA